MAINKTDSVSKAKPGSAKKFGKTEKSLQAELSLPTDVPAGTELVAEAPSTHEIPADIQSWLAEAQSAWKKQQAEDERLTLEQENGARVVYLADAAMAGNTMTDAGNMLLAQNTSASATEVESESKAALLPDEIAFNPAWLGLGLLGLAGGGGGGGGGGVVVDAVHNLVSGAVVLGPVITGHGLTVNVYAANGTTLLGTGVVSAAGTFSVDVGSYTGVVIAKLADASTGVDFTDEATGVAHDLTANLMTVGVANTGTITLNINALTTVAAQEAGAVFTGASTVTITAEIANNANTAVANTFGLTDLTGSAIVTTVDSAGNPNTAYDPADGLSNAEQYGSILAALSGVDSANGGNMQTTIDDIVTGLTITGTTGTLAPAALDVIIEGARAVSDTTAGSGDTLLTAVVSDMTQKVSPSVSIDDISVDNIILEGELATLTGTNVSGATVDLTIGGNLVAAIVTGTTWSYTLNSADLTAIGIGGETIQATATLSGATANTTRSIFVNAIPVANADTLAAAFGTPTIFAAADLLGNDTDANNDTLTIDSVTSGTGGTVVLNGDGTVTFTPNNGFNGAAANFTYTVSDGTAISSTATVTVNVAADSNIFFNPSSAPFARSISTDAAVPGITAIASVSADVSLDVSPDQAPFLALASADVFVQASADDSSARLTLNNASGDIATLSVEASGGSADASATINSNGSLTISAVNVETTGNATGSADASHASVTISGDVTLGDFITVTASGQSADASFSTSSNTADAVVFTNVTNGITVTASSADAVAQMNVFNATGTVSSIAVQATDGNSSTALADLYGSFTILDSIAVTTSGSADSKNAHLQLGNNNVTSDIGPVIDSATVNVTASGSGDTAELYANNASGTVSSITVLADNDDATALAYFSQNASAAASFTLGSTVDVTASALWSNAYLNYNQNDGASPGVIFANTTLNVTASGNSSDASFNANKASGTIVDINLTASGSDGYSRDMASAKIYGGFTINGTVTVLADRSGTDSSADAYLRLDSFNSGVDGGIVFANAAIDVTASARDSYASVDIFSASGTVSSLAVTASGVSSDAGVSIDTDGVLTISQIDVLSSGDATNSSNESIASVYISGDITLGDFITVTASGQSADASFSTSSNTADAVIFTNVTNGITVEASGREASASMNVYNATGTVSTIDVKATAGISSKASAELEGVFSILESVAVTTAGNADDKDAYLRLGTSGEAGPVLDTATINVTAGNTNDTASNDTSVFEAFNLSGTASSITVLAGGENNRASAALSQDANGAQLTFGNTINVTASGKNASASLSYEQLDATTAAGVIFSSTTLNVTASGDSSDATFTANDASGTLVDINVTASGSSGVSGDLALARIVGNLTVNGVITVLAERSGTDSSVDAYLKLGNTSGDIVFDTATINVTASAENAFASAEIYNASGTVTAINVTASGSSSSAELQILGNSEDGSNITISDTILVTATVTDASADLTLGGELATGVVFSTATLELNASGTSSGAVATISNASGTLNSIVATASGILSEADLNLYHGSVDTTVLTVGSTLTVLASGRDAFAQVRLDGYEGQHQADSVTLTQTLANGVYTFTVGNITLTHTISGGAGTVFDLDEAWSDQLNRLHPAAGFAISTPTSDSIALKWDDFATHTDLFAIQLDSGTPTTASTYNNAAAPNTTAFNNTAVSVSATAVSADAELEIGGATGTITSIAINNSATAGSSSDIAQAILHGAFSIADTISVTASGDDTKDSSADAFLKLGRSSSDSNILLDVVGLTVTASGTRADADAEMANVRGTLSSIVVEANALKAVADVSIKQSADVGTLNVGTITVTASGVSSEAHLDLYGYEGTKQQQTLTVPGGGTAAAGVYTLTMGSMTVSYELQASMNATTLFYGLQDRLEQAYGRTHLPFVMDSDNSGVFYLEFNDYVDHAAGAFTLTGPSALSVTSVISAVAVAEGDIHLNNSTISVTGSGDSADLHIANATGSIASITVSHLGVGGDEIGAGAIIEGAFTIGDITVSSTGGSAELRLSNDAYDTVITLNNTDILVTAGIATTAAGNRGESVSSLYADDLQGTISTISVSSGLSGDASANLNGNVTVAEDVLNVLATGLNASATLELEGSDSVDLTNYDVALTDMAVNVTASGSESSAELTLLDATGLLRNITVTASAFSTDANAIIDFSGHLNGNIAVTASGVSSEAGLTLTAGTPTTVTVAWSDFNNGGVHFVDGQVYTLNVGSNVITYTMQAGDSAGGDVAALTKLVEGLNAAAAVAMEDFQILHPGNSYNTNSFRIMWNDALAVHREDITMTLGSTSLRDYNLTTSYDDGIDDHDGTSITLDAATTITVTASGAGSSAEVALDGLAYGAGGSISMITADASGGNKVGTPNFFHDAFDNYDPSSRSENDFTGASAEAVVRVEGGVDAITINATHIEDNALVALSQTVQGGTVTVTGDGRTALNLGAKTVDTINLANLSAGTWGAFDLNLAMADLDATAASRADLSASMITVNDFDGDRGSINVFRPYDTSTESWAWNHTLLSTAYSENETPAVDFNAFLDDAETALNLHTDGTTDYYFGVVGSDGYLAYDISDSGITGVVKLTGVTSFDAANVRDHSFNQNLGTLSGTANYTTLNTTKLYNVSDTVYNASDLAIQFTGMGLLDELKVHANVEAYAVQAADSVSLTLTENGTGDIIFRQALITVSADSSNPGGPSYGADATLTVSDARGTVEHVGVSANGWYQDSSAQALFYSFSGAVNEIELKAVGHGTNNASADLYMTSTNGTALTESVQNLWMTVESADATANLTLASGYVVKTEVTMSSGNDMSIVTLNIEQTVHGGEVFATTFMRDSINPTTHVYGNGTHATFDLTYTNGTADKVSLGQMAWNGLTGDSSADVFTVGNFEGDFKLWLYVPDTDNADFTVSGALQTNMLTIEGFDTGATAYDDTNAWLDDRISFNNSQNGYYLKSLTDEVTVDAFLSAADTALDGTVDYYFGVVGSNGYLAMDEDGSGITQVIEFLGMTDLDYTRINGAAPVV